MKIIGYIHTQFPDKFGLPRQSGMAPLLGLVQFVPPYGNPDAFRGIEDYSHLWLLWRFDGFEGDFAPTVRPPRLGGNRRMGVFATRSPNRPNPIGLSVVSLEAVRRTPSGVELVVGGIDMVDGTAIYDVKPYLPYVDSVADAKGGFGAEHVQDALEVVFAEGLSAEDSLRAVLVPLLSADPRPHYHEDGRTYGMRYDAYEIKFAVEGRVLTVLSIDRV